MAAKGASPNTTESILQNGLFQDAAAHGCGELHFKMDETTGLWAVVAIHDTTLGPALGGCRCKPYPNSHDAIIDALRLARGMTYKAAIAGVPHGGGKSVLIAPEIIPDRQAYFQAFGTFVNDLGGRYITAKDVGTDIPDMDSIATQTSYVVGTSADNDMNADPSPFTALGVAAGIRAAVQHKLKRSSLEGVSIAIQGVGHVGYHLAKYCHAAGATLQVADVDQGAVERCVDEFNATVVSTEDISFIKTDVFAPCALGAVLSQSTIPKIQAPIVAGGANNQLAKQKDAETLAAKGILYAPDFVINAGGLIHAAALYAKSIDDTTHHNIEKIYDVLLEIFNRAEHTGDDTHQVALAMAQDTIAKAKP